MESSCKFRVTVKFRRRDTRNFPQGEITALNEIKGTLCRAPTTLSSVSYVKATLAVNFARIITSNHAFQDSKRQKFSMDLVDRNISIVGSRKVDAEKQFLETSQSLSVCQAWFIWAFSINRFGRLKWKAASSVEVEGRKIEKRSKKQLQLDQRLSNLPRT